MARPRKQAEAETRPRMLIATESFSGALTDGPPFHVHAGVTRVMSDHEIARRYPQWFAPIEPHFGTVPTETATAGPGEERA